MTYKTQSEALRRTASKERARADPYERIRASLEMGPTPGPWDTPHEHQKGEHQ